MSDEASLIAQMPADIRATVQRLSKRRRAAEVRGWAIAGPETTRLHCDFINAGGLRWSRWIRRRFIIRWLIDVGRTAHAGRWALGSTIEHSAE